MTTLAQISETQAQKATTANENFAAVSVAGIYGRRPAGTSGLTWGYYGGIFPGTYASIADGTLTLTANATNYIEADTATGALSVNAVGWTASGKKRVYSVTTNASGVTAYTDYRTVLDVAAAALAGTNVWTGVNTFDEDVVIGSGSPSATLTCNGPVTINSSLRINGWVAGPVLFTGVVTFDEDVVIGSGSPTSTLTINGPTTINSTLTVGGGISGDLGIGLTPPVAGFTNYRQVTLSGSAGSTLALTKAGAIYGQLVADNNRFYISSFGDSITFNVGGSGTGTEIGRINSIGLGIFCTPIYAFEIAASANTWGFRVNNSNASPYGFYLSFTNSPDNNTNEFLECIDGTAVRCVIYSDGDLQNHDNSYGAISDARLKTNVTDAGSQLEDFRRYRFRNYEFISDVEAGKHHRQIGLIAQEVMKVSPRLVKKGADGMYALEYSVLSVKAAKAVQELIGIVDGHETRIKALEAANEDIRAEIARLKKKAA